MLAKKILKVSTYLASRRISFINFDLHILQIYQAGIDLSLEAISDMPI